MSSSAIVVWQGLRYSFVSALAAYVSEKEVEGWRNYDFLYKYSWAVIFVGWNLFGLFLLLSCKDVKSLLPCFFDTDKPNPPQLLLPVTCNDRDASVEWQPMGDNRAPILGYLIQYNTSFTPDTWENAFDSVPATSTQFTVSFLYIEFTDFVK